MRRGGNEQVARGRSGPTQLMAHAPLLTTLYDAKRMVYARCSRLVPSRELQHEVCAPTYIVRKLNLLTPLMTPCDP